MEFGIPTLIETDSIEACAQLCRKHGLDFIEINMNLPQYQCPRVNPRQFLKLRERYGIFFTIHLEEGLDITNFNDRVSQAYLDTVADTIKLANQLDTPLLNMHMNPGVYFTLPHQKVFLLEQYQDAYYEKLLRFRQLCENAIGGGSLKINLENTGWHQFPHIQQGVLFLLESPVFCLTYDVGHDHSDGGMDEAFFHTHRQRLSHIHLHDAVGKQNHLPLGTGEINLPGKLALAEQCSCRVVIEVKTVAGLEESMEYLKQLGY